MAINIGRILITLFLFLSAHFVSSAGIYKWTDSDGNIHYGDRPKVSAKEIKVDTGHKPDPEFGKHQQKRDRILEVFDQERLEKRADNALAAQVKSEQQQKCIEAQERLEQYKTAGYLYKLDDDGNRVILENEEHANALENAQDSVDNWCG